MLTIIFLKCFINLEISVLKEFLNLTIHAKIHAAICYILILIPPSNKYRLLDVVIHEKLSSMFRYHTICE